MKPILVRRGNITVKIYQTDNAGYTEFKVADYSTGKRRFHSFADESGARRKANEIAQALKRGEADVLTLRSSDRAAYMHARSLLAPLNIPLGVAVNHFAEAVKVLGADLVLEAARDYAKRRAVFTGTPISVETLVAQFLTAKEHGKQTRLKGHENAVSDRYISTMRGHLGEFADSFNCNIADVSGQDINDFLDELPGKGRTKNNYRGSIVTLLNFAVFRKYLPVAHGILDTVGERQEAAFEIEVYTPEQIAKLLKAASGPMVPALAIRAFAGLRTAEFHRMDWSDFTRDGKNIRISAGKSKTGSRRIVPVSDNLSAWLAPYRQASGPIWPNGIASLMNGQPKVAASAGVQWLHNALRHSFVSYRTAQIQNVNQVALEAGNSPMIIFKHYRELVTPDEARAWFAICPQTAENVVPMAAQTA